MEVTQAPASAARARPLRLLWTSVKEHPWWLIPVLAIPALMAPMVLTNRAFGPDWTNHLWLVWNQSRHISHTGLPTYFVNADLVGAFYPHYAFYGGSLYAFAGGISALFNDSATKAYVFTYALGFTMSYAGWLWLSLQAGVRGWRAHIPSLVFITAAYPLTNVYARGAWPEFMATSAIPLVIASAIALLRSDRLRAGAVICFIGSVVLLTGSHNLTLLWGTVFFAAVALILFFAARRSHSAIPWRRLPALSGLALLGVGINAWFLVPLLVHSGDVASSLSPDRHYLLDAFPGFNKPWNVFHPLRHTPSDSTTADLDVQLPVFALLWGAAAAVLLRRSASPFWRSIVAGTVILMAAYLALVFFEDAWKVIPDVFSRIQFAYRLSTYTLICVTGLVLVGLVLVEKQTRRRVRVAYLGTLVVIVGFGSALAIDQVWTTPSRIGNPNLYIQNRNDVYAGQHHEPRSWYDIGMRDVSARTLTVRNGRYLGVPPALFDEDRTDVRLDAAPGSAPLITNVAGGSYIVKVEGDVERVGRNVLGFTAVKRKPGHETGPVRLTVALNHSPEVVVGIGLTLISLAGTLVVLAALALRRRRMT